MTRFDFVVAAPTRLEKKEEETGSSQIQWVIKRYSMLLQLNLITDRNTMERGKQGGWRQKKNLLFGLKGNEQREREKGIELDVSDRMRMEKESLRKQFETEQGMEIATQRGRNKRKKRVRG